MAEQDILDLVGDGEKQIQAVIERLKEMLSLVKDINANQIKIESKTSGSGSVKDLRANIDELNKTQAEFARTLQELKKQEDAIIQTQAKLNASYYEEAKAVAALKVEHQERMRQINEEAKANNANYQQRKALEKAQKEHAKAMQAINKASEREAKELQKAWEAYTREQEKKRIAEEKAAAAAAKAAQPYNRLNDLHKRLVEHAQQLGAKYGVTSKEFENASNRANNLGKKLSEIDAKLGNHRRNVGNYASAWNGLQHQMGMVLRELPNLGISLNTFVLSLSNNLPMLFDEIKKVNEQNKILAEQGKKTVPVLRQMLQSIMSWQTLLIVGVTLITKYGDEIYNALRGATKETLAAEKAQKKYNEAIRNIEYGSMDEANKEISRLKMLVAISQDATQATHNRNKAVEELQKNYPTTFGQLDKHRIMEGDLKNAINETNKALIARSLANAAQEKFIKAGGVVYELTKAYESQLKSYQYVQAAIRKAEEEGTKDVMAGPYGQTYGEVLEERLKNERDALNKIRNQRGLALKQQREFLDDYLDLSKKAEAALFKGVEPPKGGEYDPFRDEIKSQSEYLKELAKLDEQRLREEAEYNRREYEDDKKTLEERLQAYKLYMYARSAMADAAIRGELEDTQNKIEKIKELEGRTNKTYTDAENSLLVMKEALMVRERRLREQLEADKAAIYRQGLSDVKKITNEEFNEFKSQNNERIADTFRAMEEEVTALKASYDKRKISFRKFRAELRRIQTEQALQAVDASIAAIDNEMEANKDNAEYYALLTKYKIELENKRHELVVKNAKSEADLSEVELRRVVGIIKTIHNAYSQVSSEIRGMINDRYDAEQEAFQKQLEQIDKRKNKEIEAINAMALSDEERINRVSAAEAKAAVERAIIEKKERQSRIRQAQFEKQAAISEISLKTSIAVMEALTEGDPYTKAIRAAAAAALGAAQLARAISTPLPQFASGTDNAPEGLAIVGEKGRELKITPDGEVSLTPGKATLDYLKKGTKIIPADETNKIIRNLGTYGYPLPVITKDGNENVELLQAINEQTKQVVRNLKGLKDTGRNQESINWQLYLNQKTKGIC